METTDAAREIIEVLHTQLEVMREQLACAHDRELFLRSLLESDPARDRETRLIELVVTDREEIARLHAELRGLRPSPEGPRHHIPIDASARPVAPIAAAVRREPSALHAGIMAALEEAPDGLTARQLESAVASPTPLKHILRRLAHSGRVVRLGDGRFGLPVGELVGAVGVNGTGA